MEDSFQARVDKIFGSLTTTTVSASQWSLTDEELERRKWNRPSKFNQQQHDEDEEIEPPIHFRKPDLIIKEEDDDDDDDEEIDEIDGKKRQRGRSGGVKAIVDEDFDVQSNIGRDCTLDFEEEEDEYDKVAVGTRNTGDREYVREVKLADFEDEELDELPHSFLKVTRDPCADPLAAKARLEEDVGTSGTNDTSLLSDNSVAENTNSETVKRKELDSKNPKPILKKRKNLMDSTSQKRVRFSCNLNNSSQNEQGSPKENVSNLSENSPGLPDYLRNPSKYTRFTLDSSPDMDDQANKEAFMDIVRHQRKEITENSSECDLSNTPRSVTFIPRMKPEYESVVMRKEREHRSGDDMNSKGWSVSVTAEEDSQETEVADMEEDEPCIAADNAGFQKPSRKYRARNSENI